MKKLELKLKKAYESYVNGWNHAAAMYVNAENVVDKNIKF